MKYLILDVETTGVDVNRDRVIELAWCLHDAVAGTTITNVHRFNPGVPVPEEATAVHGITTEMLLAEPDFKDHAESLLDQFSRADVIGGYNVTFDLAMMASEFGRLGLTWPPVGARVIDAFRIWQAQTPRTLENAYRHYVGQPDEDSFHGALYDVACTLDVLKAQAQGVLADLTHEHGQVLVDPAGKIALDENGEAVFTFGKNQGEPVLKNRGYAEWMLGADFAESTKQVIRELFNDESLAPRLRQHITKAST